MEPCSVDSKQRLQRLRHAQRGVSALEFALVFPLLFFILYMAIAYGLIFAAQQSMNYAAETMARESLLFGSGDESPRATAADWLKSVGGVSALSKDIITQEDDPSLGEFESLVIFRYDYANHPIVPWLGPKFFGGVLFPDELVATAIVDSQITGKVGWP